jgi:hypothetical protein
MNYKLNEKLSKVATNPGVGNALYSIGSSITDRYNEIWAVNFKGDSTASYYADLAEKYTVDQSVPLPVGTVMEVSAGSFDAELCDTDLSPCVIGVISAKPGIIMNEGLGNSAIVGLVGTLPVRVVGVVDKKDILVSGGSGCLRAAVDDAEKVFKVAISLETSNDINDKLIKCFVK